MKNYDGMTPNEILQVMDTQRERLKEQDRERKLYERKYKLFELKVNKRDEEILAKVRAEENSLYMKKILVCFLAIVYVLFMGWDFILLVTGIVMAAAIAVPIICYLNYKKKKIPELVQLQDVFYQNNKLYNDLMDVKKRVDDNELQIHEMLPFIPWEYCNKEAYTTMYGYVKDGKVENVTAMVKLYENEHGLQKDKKEEFFKKYCRDYDQAVRNPVLVIQQIINENAELRIQK